MTTRLKHKLALFTILFSFLSFFGSAFASDWYFPIQGYENRDQYKTFNQYIDKNFYEEKESLFPTQYTGYHVADDLEINPGEESQNVPVYAVSDGKIIFAGPVSGYGGAILLDIAGDNHTALYGHVKIKGTRIKAGNAVKGGQFLAYLGNGFSSETGGERKHLHFGIYNGKEIYYRGYETNTGTVRNKWVDPESYLVGKGANDTNRQLPDSNENANTNSIISDFDNAMPPTGQNVFSQGDNAGLTSRTSQTSLFNDIKNRLSQIRNFRLFSLFYDFIAFFSEQ